MTAEKISAVALKVASMPTSVRFYRDLLGLEMIYRGEDVLGIPEGTRTASAEAAARRFTGRTPFHLSDPDGHELSFARPL